MHEIVWMENKQTSTGKAMVKATLKDAAGREWKDVTFWGSEWDLAALLPGGKVSVKIGEKQNGQYVNYTAYKPFEKHAPASLNPPGSFVGGRGGGIAKAQETKATGIKEAQDNKDKGVMTSATARDATLIMLEWARQIGLEAKSAVTLEVMKDKWLEIRNFLTLHWETPNLPF